MKKKIIASVLTGMMVLGLAACGSSASQTSTTASTAPAASTESAASETAAPAASAESAASETAASAEVSDLGDVTLIMSTRDQFLSTLEGAAKDYADSLGITLTTQDAQNDTNKMLQFIETAANAGQKACIVNMVDPTTTSACIEAAGDMKLVFVNRVPSDITELTDNAVCVTSDERLAGTYQGEYLAKYFTEKGQTDVKYLMLSGNLGMTNTTQRTEFAISSMNDNGLNATEATAPVVCEWDRAEAMNQMSTLIASGLEYDCIISNNDEMALGAIEALQNANIDPSTIPIVGIDATADGCAAVVNGTLAMTVFQDPVGQGTGAIQACINLVNGDALNAGTSFDIDSETGHILWVPFEPVTAENVADYQ
ncbi:MAG: substrate-binding domain-containing protein [Lachnospiraceae bacterium]|nr:substrate-binding domain-containing protein [Lachnospiraceae bacterium]